MLLPFDIITNALKSHDLLGLPFIPPSFRPSAFLQVDFPSSNTSATLGNALTPSDASEPPSISFLTTEMSSGDEQSAAKEGKGKSYTVVCVDPDAPSRTDHKFGPWRHYVHPGFRTHPDALSEAQIKSEQGGLQAQSKEEALSPWAGPGPGPKTGVHRYVFLLYEEKPGKKVEKGSTINGNEKHGRRNFDVARFAQENELTLVGINFFTVRSHLIIMEWVANKLTRGGM